MEEAAAQDLEPSQQEAITTSSPPPPSPPAQQPPLGLTPSEYAFLGPAIDTYHTYQIYKHFIRSCGIIGGGAVQIGCLRELSVISGLPASTSTERLDILDEEKRITGFTIIGGEHRLRNYTSVTTVNQFEEGGEIWTIVLESYVVDVPVGNSEEDTRLFADTVIKLNLQKLKSLAEAAAAAEVRNS